MYRLITIYTFLRHTASTSEWIGGAGSRYNIWMNNDENISQPDIFFTLTFRSLSETFVRRNLFSSSSGSCHGSEVTWQEITQCGSVCSCPHPGPKGGTAFNEPGWGQLAYSWMHATAQCCTAHGPDSPPRRTQITLERLVHFAAILRHFENSVIRHLLPRNPRTKSSFMQKKSALRTDG